MKTTLSLTLRRVRSSIRTDINTGAAPQVEASCSNNTNRCTTADSKVPESRTQATTSKPTLAYGRSGG